MFDFIFIEKRFTELEQIMETSIHENGIGNDAKEEPYSCDDGFRVIFLF